MLQNIIFTPDDEGDNQGGIRHEFILVADLDDMSTVSEPASMDAASTFAELATISVDHVFDQNGFMKIKATYEEGDLECAMAGEMDGKVFNNKLSFSIPGQAADHLGFKRWAKDRDLICLVQDKAGVYRQIGSIATPARFEEVTGSLGGGGSQGKKGTSFVISDHQPYPAPIYTGAIQLNEDASQSGS